MPDGLTLADVRAIIGDVEDVIAAEIIDTGATVAELEEAQAWLSADDDMVNVGRAMPHGRAGMLVTLLQRIEADREEEER